MSEKQRIPFCSNNGWSKFSKPCRGSDEVIIHSVKGGKKGLNYLNLKMLSMNKKKCIFYSIHLQAIKSERNDSICLCGLYFSMCVKSDEELQSRDMNIHRV